MLQQGWAARAARASMCFLWPSGMMPACEVTRAQLPCLKGLPKQSKAAVRLQLRCGWRAVCRTVPLLAQQVHNLALLKPATSLMRQVAVVVQPGIRSLTPAMSGPDVTFAAVDGRGIAVVCNCHILHCWCDLQLHRAPLARLQHPLLLLKEGVAADIDMSPTALCR
jgi:hypothetical protein